MQKFLHKVQDVSAYNTFKASNEYVEPNVTLITSEGHCSFNPYVVINNPFANDPYINDPKLVVIYDVTSTNEDTLLFHNEYIESIMSIEIDGTEINSVVNTYRFNTIGEHVIKYYYYNDYLENNNSNLLSSLLCGAENDIPPIKKIYIPNSITGLSFGSGYTFSDNIYIEFISIPNTINYIYARTFENCSNLSTIRCASNIAPQLENNDVFLNMSQTGTLYVPTGATGYDNWLTALGSGWTKVEY